GSSARRTRMTTSPAGVSYSRTARSRTVAPWPDHQPAMAATARAAVTGFQPKTPTAAAATPRTATSPISPHQRPATALAQVMAATARAARVPRSRSRSSRDDDRIPQVGQLGLADARHLEEVFDLREPASRLPMGDDAFGQDGPHSGEGLEVCRRGGVEVDQHIVDEIGRASGRYVLLKHLTSLF